MNNEFVTDMLKFQKMWDKASKEVDLTIAIEEEARKNYALVNEKCNEIKELKNKTAADFYFSALTNVDKIFHQQLNEKADPELAKIVDIVAGSQNPIQAQTHGEDQAVKITPDFTDGETLRDIADLRIEIEKLEKRYHDSTFDGEESKTKKLKGQLDKLRLEIEELNSKLAKHPMKDVT